MKIFNAHSRGHNCSGIVIPIYIIDESNKKNQNIYKFIRTETTVKEQKHSTLFLWSLTA